MIISLCAKALYILKSSLYTLGRRNKEFDISLGSPVLGGLFGACKTMAPPLKQLFSGADHCETSSQIDLGLSIMLQLEFVGACLAEDHITLVSCLRVA